MSRDVLLYLKDIVDSCDRILSFTIDMDMHAFVDDELTYYAVLHNLIIIGEAAKHVPDDVRRQYPEINWRGMAGMRDVISHGYFSVDDEIVWDVVANEIPKLVPAVRHVIEEEKHRKD